MVTNLSFLQTFTKGDTAKMKKYIDMYLDTANQKIEVMKAAVQEADYETLKVAAHTMKSQAKYMGISNVEATIVSVEHACNEKQNLDNLPALVNTVCEILSQSVTELREQVGQL
jgi:HPt (histidine-containing phosphotransfer) domain-containing protein